MVSIDNVEGWRREIRDGECRREGRRGVVALGVGKSGRVKLRRGWPGPGEVGEVGVDAPDIW